MEFTTKCSSRSYWLIPTCGERSREAGVSHIKQWYATGNGPEGKHLPLLPHLLMLIGRQCQGVCVCMVAAWTLKGGCNLNIKLPISLPFLVRLQFYATCLKKARHTQTLNFHQNDAEVSGSITTLTVSLVIHLNCYSFLTTNPPPLNIGMYNVLAKPMKCICSENAWAPHTQYLYLLVSHFTPQGPADHLSLSWTIICVSFTVLSDTIHNSICVALFQRKCMCMKWKVNWTYHHILHKWKAP